jgi:hypothetical protein
VVCLITGAISVSALAHPVFLIVPAIAVASGLVALRRIGRSGGELTGETVATAGLTLAVVFCLAGLGAYFVPRWQGKREATQFGLRFLEYLQAGETARAVNLMEPPGFRLAENANFAEVFTSDRKALKQLDAFVTEQAIVPILVKLGGRSEIRTYDVEAYGTIEGELGAHVVYEVAYSAGDGAPRQFLVMLHCSYRRDAEKPTEGGWFIRKISGPPYVPHSVRVREAAVHEHGAGGEHDGHSH